MKSREQGHIKLLCDIGEMIDLFVDSTSLEAFLDKIVLLVSKHMDSEVCSVYLFSENTKEIVLKATRGLSGDSVNKIRLKLGEGLSGLALKEMRPICERDASRNENYKYFSDIGEEKYESFLAVPILRGMTRVGVMVVQNSLKNYFTDEDVRVLRAITSQLANTIETAKILMSINEDAKEDTGDLTQSDLKFVKGKAGAAGLAYAPLKVISGERFFDKKQLGFFKKYSIEDFKSAVSSTEKILESLQKDLEERLSDVASMIFTAQILMLKDNEFLGAILSLIESGINPPDAIVSIVREYIEKFEKMSDSYLREKKHDVEDVGRALFDSLVGSRPFCLECENSIVVLKELFPSDILKLSLQNIKGIILLSGGVTSHLAILARSLRIPLVISENHELLNIKEGTEIFLDAELGNIYIDPTEDVLRTFKEKEEALKRLEEEESSVSLDKKTKDGTPIKIMANINLLGDVHMAVKMRADGIGLYRTEFPFIIRSDFPSEEEQFVIYKKLIESMGDKEITFRTLDIGGDKVLSYYDYGKEENPFLGMRSIRFSLNHKELFAQQLRAILRASDGSSVRIMFPMISSLDEFCEARNLVLECFDEVQSSQNKKFILPKIGLMIELPAVLEIINELADAADFFSIGTNDFIQYMLAVDRTNEKVSDFYLPHHPSVLRGLKKVVDAANAQKIDVSICGDMAHSEKYLSFFLGIGVRKFSVDSSYLPLIHKAISSIEIKDAIKKAQDVLSKATISEIGMSFI